MFLNMPRWSRIGAFLIDTATIRAFGTLILMYTPKVMIIGQTNILADMARISILLSFYVLIATLYNVLFYRFFGATFGKFMLRQNIVNNRGEKINAFINV